MKKFNIILFAFLIHSINSNAQVVFTGNYSNVELGCTPLPATINAALGAATATDACSTPTLTISDGPVQYDGCRQSQTRTFTGRNACGYTASVARTVTWTFDITPPVFTGNYSTIPLGCNPSQTTIYDALGSAAATDDCSVPMLILIINEQLDFEGCNFSLTRTFEAADDCGNITTISRTVTWTEDLAAPVFTGSYSSVFLGCNPSASSISSALGSATATDACDGVNITTSDNTVASDGCYRTQTRTFIATDACGNTATKTRAVSWIHDETPPVFTGDYSIATLGYEPTPAMINTALGSATAMDACSTVIISQVDANIISTGCNRQQTRTFTATDVCGNTASISRTARWKQECELTVSIGKITVNENAGIAQIPVTLLFPSSSIVSVNYKTINGTAKHPKDFNHKTGTITFSPGQVTQNISITIVADNISEGEEEFIVSLSNAINATIDNGNGEVTISEEVPGSITKHEHEFEKDRNETIKLAVPNPQRKQGVLKFNGITIGIFDVILFDVNGKQVANLRNYKNDFSLSKLKPGLYFYQVYQKKNNNELKKITGKLLITD